MKEQRFYVVLVVTMLLASSQIMGKGCDDSGIEVLYVCGESIDKDKPAPPTPSKDCCTLVQVIGMKCVCEVINKGIEATIDMQKLVKVASSCGRPLAPGSQCGTYRVPPGA